MSETKSELERVYTVPLSRAWIAPRHQRTKRAVNMLKEYAEKHMKSSEIKIETSLNEELWNRGITSPPRRITVKMSRDEDGVVTISLPKEAKAPREESKEKGTKVTSASMEQSVPAATVKAVEQPTAKDSPPQNVATPLQTAPSTKSSSKKSKTSKT